MGKSLKEEFERLFRERLAGAAAEEVEAEWDLVRRELAEEQPLDLQFRQIQVLNDGRVEIRCECGEVFLVDPASESNMVRRDGDPDDLLLRCPKCGAVEGV